MDSNTGALVVDVLILTWLIATWFYEGHHRRCRIELVCASCGKAAEAPCHADHRNEEVTK